MKVAIALSNSEGQFKELRIINSSDTIDFFPENENGVPSLTVLVNGEVEEWYYIDYVEIG